jgi:hypothetical protein
MRYIKTYEGFDELYLNVGDILSHPVGGAFKYVVLNINKKIIMFVDSHKSLTIRYPDLDMYIQSRNYNL